MTVEEGQAEEEFYSERKKELEFLIENVNGEISSMSMDNVDLMYDSLRLYISCK